MKETTTLKSGKVLAFGEPSFEEASLLFEILAAELLKVNVELGDLSQYLTSQGDVSELLKDPKILNTLKNVIFQLLSSKAFKAQLILCMKRSTYDSEKITIQTFEQNRADYLPVCWEVAKQTLFPFIENLLSGSLGSTSKPQGSPL